MSIALAYTPAPARPAHWAPLDLMFRMLMAAALLPSLLWRDGFKDAWFATAFLSQLREAERFARAMLLRDARAIAATLPEAKGGKRVKAARISIPQIFTMDHARWRASFRLAPRLDKRTAKRTQPLRRLRQPTPAQARDERLFALMLAQANAACVEAPPPMPRHTPRGCALRYEALRRVVENPAPYARRLARRLARQGGDAIAAALDRVIVPDYALPPFAASPPLGEDTS